jgi:hypothetical protein
VIKTLHLSSPAMSGTGVKQAQRRLTDAGYYGGKVDGIYGPVTGAAAKHARWALGYADKNVSRRYDQGLDDFLSGARKPTVLMGQRAKQRSKQIAASAGVGSRAAERMVGWYKLGWREQPAGSNVVPQLQAFAKRLGLASYYVDMGFAWCGFSVFTSALAEGSKAAKAGLLEGKFNALYTPEIRTTAAACRFWLKQVSLRQIQHGTMLEFDFGGSNGTEVDHVGYALGAPGEAVEVDGKMLKPKKSEVVTVEGNTSYDDAGSQSNGGCVAVKIRPLSVIRVAIEIA